MSLLEKTKCPDADNDKELHDYRQSGELYRQKEKYKEQFLTEYAEASKYKSFPEIFEMICEKETVPSVFPGKFVYFIDYIYVLDEVRGYQFGNITPGYSIMLSSGLEQLKYNITDSLFCRDYDRVVSSIETLVWRIINMLRLDPDKNREKIVWFTDMLDKPARHFDEAVQRILFVNQILWQTDHRLLGLGALDELLYPYYLNDIREGVLSRERAKGSIKEFLNILHQYYWYKSNMLMGDTGQIIVLGGLREDGSYLFNELSEIFIGLIQELQRPDPKILLRVSSRMPEHVMEYALNCMATGVGSPIISNDDVVIPALINFGISNTDAYHYTVSACWEPLIGGKSTSLNNMTTINYMRSFENLFRRERLERITDFDTFVDTYITYLKRNLNAVMRVVGNARFQYDPVLSVFIEGCRDREKDVSAGGARYMDAGVTSVALGNVIDSIMNIKEYVFDKKIYSLSDVKRILLLNYEGADDVKQLLQKKKRFYGSDQPEIITLTRRIIDETSKYLSGFRTEQGGRIKFGLSAPTYIDAAKGMRASFDGREKGTPFVVHISNESLDSYTEILNFASELDYGGNRFNGNVIDIMMNGKFISDNMDKFRTMLMVAISSGIFQLQINVVSSQQLVDAKKNPAEYPNLIVRVWGFSAYFRDLPEEYQDVLIKRAKESEGI